MPAVPEDARVCCVRSRISVLVSLLQKHIKVAANQPFPAFSVATKYHHEMDEWGLTSDPAASASLQLDPLVEPILGAIEEFKHAQKQQNEARDEQNDDEAENGNFEPAIGDLLLAESNTKEESSEGLFRAVLEGDKHAVEAILTEKPHLADLYYPNAETGAPALVYALVLNHTDIVEILLDHGADPDACDSFSAGYTPLMWAVHRSMLPEIRLLLDHQADPFLINPNGGTKDAVSLVSPADAAVYEYFQMHNLLKPRTGEEIRFFEPPSDVMGFSGAHDENEALEQQIRLQSVSAADFYEDQEAELSPGEYSDLGVLPGDEEYQLTGDSVLTQTPEFAYDKLLPEQYIKFSDSDIPSLLDYIFALRTEYAALQHDTKVPAAVVFQLLRYAHSKVDSDELSEFLFDCFTARLRSVTKTKSGVFNMAVGNDVNPANSGDIVLLSYWLSVVQFLHFYILRSGYYKDFPRFLQELVNIVQSLTATLSFSINSRLNALMDDAMLNFTSLVDVSNVLYAKDWNLFKNKNKKHPSTYDDILDMLYPPSQTELMRPSPLRYIQVLGALDYVLRLHGVDTLLQFQTYSQVFYCINASIFNRIVANSRYCSRAKAIQLRLNISALEDWLRSHNYKIYRPESIGGLEQLVGPEFALNNVLESTGDKHDPHALPYYYNLLYYVGKWHLAPTIELLQLLQCMLALTDEESFINTINQFDALNYYQMFKVMNKLYKYEVDEKKLPRALTNLVKRLSNEQGEAQIARNHLHYMTQSNFLLKEEYIYLNPNYVFGVALPNTTELINNYGAGLGGVRVLRARKYQPSLPISVVDDVDDILVNNRATVNDTYDYEEEEGEKDDVDEEKVVATGALAFKGDELFKEVQMPGSLAHKNWGAEDIESNPW